VFSDEELSLYKKQAGQVNEDGTGDQATFYVKKLG
jgi:hypothetical protein